MDLCSFALCTAFQLGGLSEHQPLIPPLDFGTELQQGTLAGIVADFAYNHVMTEDDKRAAGAWVRSKIVNGYHRLARLIRSEGAPQSGRWVYVKFDIDGVDPDNDGDADSYIEWDEVDYNYDGRVDARAGQQNATSIEGVEALMGGQLGSLDAWMRAQRM